MTEYVKVARVEDIPPGTRLFYEFAEETVIIFNIAGHFYCIADLCSHDDGPLEDGDLDGYAVECPRHGARFDVRNGRALCMPATEPIPTYQVEIKDGNLYVAAVPG
ncbi:MAG: non-heme iron oxygenase ferredoxin subunit [Anaerolinea sp.]|nr:non-heme iron oxygenase ferredoxin subunit [Anaerolinea sp.]